MACDAGWGDSVPILGNTTFPVQSQHMPCCSEQTVAPSKGSSSAACWLLCPLLASVWHMAPLGSTGHSPSGSLVSLDLLGRHPSQPGPYSRSSLQSHPRGGWVLTHPPHGLATSLKNQGRAREPQMTRGTAVQS